MITMAIHLPASRYGIGALGRISGAQGLGAFADGLGVRGVAAGSQENHSKDRESHTSQPTATGAHRQRGTFVQVGGVVDTRA